MDHVWSNFLVYTEKLVCHYLITSTGLVTGTGTDSSADWEARCFYQVYLYICTIFGLLSLHALISVHPFFDQQCGITEVLPSGVNSYLIV